MSAFASITEDDDSPDLVAAFDEEVPFVPESGGGRMAVDEEEEARNEYINDTFGGDIKVTQWKDAEQSAVRVEVNAADKHMLDTTRVASRRALAVLKRMTGRTEAESIPMSQRIAIFLNRDFFTMLKDSIDGGMPTGGRKCEYWEIREMVRMWLLMAKYKTTAARIFSEPRWYAIGGELKIGPARYKQLFQWLGRDVPVMDVHLGNSESDTSVWGSLNQHSESIDKMEQHIASVGKQFHFDAVNDYVIDDDKLRHSSRNFRALGLQMSGFRGSRVGPVSNCLASLQLMLVHSIYLSRIKTSGRKLGNHLWTSSAVRLMQ